MVCTLGLGVCSEFLFSFLPNDREFDILDIVANVAGSLSAVVMCSWYHRRMMDRRRQRRHHRGPSTGARVGLVDDMDTDETVDVELGATQKHAPASLEQRVDEWDENDPDEEIDDAGGQEQGRTTKGNALTRSGSSGDLGKRTE